MRYDHDSFSNWKRASIRYWRRFTDSRKTYLPTVIKYTIDSIFRQFFHNSFSTFHQTVGRLAVSNRSRATLRALRNGRL